MPLPDHDRTISAMPSPNLIRLKDEVVASPEGTLPIEGFIDPRFVPVLDAFRRHFAQRKETGASVCVVWRGRPVVDLWGGHADAARTRPWTADTICNVMSVTKAVTATCLHLLVERGLVDLDAPVARYWPGFAAAGKDGIRVRWLLDNRAGLPVLHDDLCPGAIYDWGAMTSALARQPALVPPGGEPAYHIRTSGFLVGELVRRVDGRSLGRFFREEIAQPFGIDFHIGVQDADLARCAEFIPQSSGTLLDGQLHDPEGWVARAGRQLPRPMDYNDRRWRQSEIPSSNGHGNARSVARFYSLLAGAPEGPHLLRPETLAKALAVQHEAREIVMGRRYRQALGFLLNTPGDFEIGPNPRAFGLLGAGGALGFADPDAGLAIGYVENRMHAAMGLGERAPALVEAMYACVD